MTRQVNECNGDISPINELRERWISPTASAPMYLAPNTLVLPE